MTQVTGGFIGLIVGSILVIGIQIACYKLFRENYEKAVVFMLLSVIIGVLAAILLIPVTE